MELIWSKCTAKASKSYFYSVMQTQCYDRYLRECMVSRYDLFQDAGRISKMLERKQADKIATTNHLKIVPEGNS